MLRSLVKRLARPVGMAVASLDHVGRPFLDHPPHTTFDLMLVYRFGDLRNLNFIQVGANDGAREDPLLPYLESCGWSGLMFEPLAAQHAALQRRHGGNSRLEIRRHAIDATPGRRTMYELGESARARHPDWTGGLGSFRLDRLLAACAQLQLPASAIVTEEVQTVTWDEVWAAFGPRQCDVLVIDAEGEDIRLLRLAGLAQHRPALVRFEHACSDLADRLAFYGELLELGYELCTAGGDTVATLPRDRVPPR